jgi:hypothetical protein
MHNAVNNGRMRKTTAAAALLLAAAATLGAAPRTASAASDFSSAFAQAAPLDPATPFVVVDVSGDDQAAPAAATHAADINELRLQNNAHPIATAPLPPALLTGSGMLIGNWMARRMFKRRWI